MMDATQLIDELTAVLMQAYQALPVQDQEGSLGDLISEKLHDVQRYYFTQAYEAQEAKIKRMAT